MATAIVDLPQTTSARDNISISINGRSVYSQDELDDYFTSTYDEIGRLKEIKDTQGRVTSRTYDETTGQLLTVTSPAPESGTVTTAYAYEDGTGRLKSVTNAEGTAVETTTYFGYDIQGRKTRIWGSGVQPQEYVYDPVSGQQIELHTWQDEAGWDADTWPSNPPTPQTTYWQYEPETGLLIHKFYGYGNYPFDVIDYIYTPDGRLATEHTHKVGPQNMEGRTITYTYDAAGKVRTIDYADSTPDVTFTYDRLGRPVKVEQGNVMVHEYTNMRENTGSAVRGPYDLENEKVTHLDGQSPPNVVWSKTIHRGYHDSGNNTARLETLAVVNSGGNPEYVSEFDYDSMGRLNSVTNPYNIYTNFEYTYETDHRHSLVYQINETWRGGDYSVTNTYDGQTDLLTEKETATTYGTVTHVEYTYNEAGQRITMRDLVDDRSSDHGYNDRGELTSWHAVNPSNTPVPPHFEFDYDAIGNRTEMKLDTVTQVEYDANVFNQYEQLTYPTPVPTVVVEPAYNVDGDLTDDGNWLYSYDGAGRLVAVEPKGTPVDGSVKVEYAYDYMNRCVKWKVYMYWSGSWAPQPVTEVHYLYAGMQCIEELNASGTVQKRYVWGLDLAGRLDYLDNPFVSFAGAGGVGGLLAVNFSSITKCYTYDGNGNVLNLVDVLDGEVDASYQYGPYGEPLEVDDDLNNPYRFSTKWTDLALAGKGLALYDYGFRWYHAGLGRWTARDPLGEIDSANLYAMLRNTLIHHIDTHGLHLFALEGTSFGYGDRANTQLFYDQTSHPKKYYPGPNVRAGFWNLRKVHNDACKAYCSDKYKGIIPELNFVGWSRGAAGSIVVGYRLDEYGCCCCKGNGETPLYYGSMPLGICINPMWEHHKNIEINFMGLFDAVHMSTIYTPGHFTTNVRAGYHARRTAPMFFHDPAHMVFPQLNTGGIQCDIYRYWDRPATEGIWRKMLIGRFGVFPGAYMKTHGEVGGAKDRLNNDAYCWIVRMALMHNVPINPSALTNAQCREF